MRGMAGSLPPPPPSPSSSHSISIAASSRPDKGDGREKTKATVEGKYEVNKSTAAGDGRLKASLTEATFANGSSLDGLVLSLEKACAFILDHTVKDNAH